jgi:hypothetical protein
LWIHVYWNVGIGQGDHQLPQRQAHTENTDLFIQDLRQRMIGAPEISRVGFLPFQNAIRDAFNGRASHGVIVKTYSVTNLAVKDAPRRYSPAILGAV